MRDFGVAVSQIEGVAVARTPGVPEGRPASELRVVMQTIEVRVFGRPIRIAVSDSKGPLKRFERLRFLSEECRMRTWRYRECWPLRAGGRRRSASADAPPPSFSTTL